MASLATLFLILLLACTGDKLGMVVIPALVIAVAKYVEGKCGLCHKTKVPVLIPTITCATTKTATA